MAAVYAHQPHFRLDVQRRVDVYEVLSPSVLQPVRQRIHVAGLPLQHASQQVCGRNVSHDPDALVTCLYQLIQRSALQREDGSFAPAHQLPDGRLERAGRSATDRAPSPLANAISVGVPGNFSCTAAILAIGDELLSGKVRRRARFDKLCVCAHHCKLSSLCSIFVHRSRTPTPLSCALSFGPSVSWS